MTISFSGLASGLDTSSWVESLVKLKQAKIDTLQEEKEGIELTKDTLESIKSFFSSFRSVLEKVTDSKFGIAATDLFAQNLATSANLDILTATATTEAEESTYNVLVDQLATNSAAKSNYSYMTTIVQTTTATADSKLTNLGVKTGNIGVKVNGVERGIEITESDTIASFIEKLQNIGVNATFNDKTGIFSMDISANDINDIDKTGIVNAFKLSGVNEGYTSNSLKITSTDTVYSAATNDTKLSELGAHAGTITIKANDAEYQITIDENTTLDEFIKGLNDNKISASLDKTGVLTIVDANITDEGTTNIKNALGLELDIYSNTQKSNDLSHKTVITQTTAATSDTLLKDLGVNIQDDQTVIVKNSSNEYTTITVGTDTTIGDLLTKISNAGLYAAIDSEGRVEISGGTITGGTFDAVKALGLTSEPYTAITTGKPLTETVKKAELVTLDTKLVDEMKVRAGYIEVTDNDGNKFYEKIYHGQTLADFMADMGNLGIYTKLRDDGVLEITGGAFATLSDDKVNELIANGTIREADDRYKQGTDLLTCLYGSSVISTDQITVASTYSKSRALTKEVTNTIAASLTSTLGNLSLQADGTAIFDVRGDKRTIEVAKTDTLQNLMDKLKNVGIASSWNSNTQQFTIENATLEGGTANLGSVLNLTKTISGKYVTSNALNKLETVTIDATRSTTLDKYGISNSMSEADRTLNLYDNEAKLVGSLTVTEASTIGDILDFVNNNAGMNASIVDGILQIEGGYIENAALEKAMGLTTENKTSFVLGSIMTVTTAGAVTGSTTLGDIISTLGTTDAVKDGYTLSFNGVSLNVSESTTLDDLISQIYDNKGSASLDSTGRLLITGGAVTGSVAEALGFTTVSTTTAVSATGKTLVTTKTEYADLETKMSDVGVADDSTIILNDKEGNAYRTITVSGSTTLKDIFDELKAEGIDGIIANGVISLKSAEHKYITGTVATALGIDTQTVTDVVNTSASSTAQITYTGETVANLKSTLGEIGAITADDDSIIIYDKDKNAIGTINNLTTSSTIEDMFAELAKYGITGSIKDGIISLELADGNYAVGSIMDNLGISVSTITISTTEAITVTSSAKVTYSETTTASATTTLGELLNTIKIDGTITASGITGTVIGISTAEDLVNLAKLTNAGRYVTRNKTFVLMNDIDLSGVTDWVSIGNNANYYSQMFCGTFDGQGHKISNLNKTISDHTSEDRYVNGLFGLLNNATIKNLQLDNFNFSADVTSDDTNYLYGGGFLAANSYGANISGVTVTNSSAKNITMSGLWGSTYHNSTITNCSTDYTITANISNSNVGIVGGLIGNILGAYTVSISQSSSTMNASGSFFLASGLVGYIYSDGSTLNIDNCYFGGRISSTRNSDNNSICGLVGFYTDGSWSSPRASKLNISNSYVDADLSAPNGFVNTIIGGHYGPSTAVKNNITLNNVFYSKSMASLGEINIGNNNNTYVNLTRNNVGIANSINDAIKKGNFNRAIWSEDGIITYHNPYTIIDNSNYDTTSNIHQFNENSTIQDILDIDPSITLENGVLKYGNSGWYLTGPLADALGIRTTTTTVGMANTSSVAITFTSQTPATEDTKIADLVGDLGDGNIIIHDSSKNAIATITVDNTTTIKDLFAELEKNGITATMKDGIISLDSKIGNYITGDVADALGIKVIEKVGTGTSTGGGGGSTSTIAIEITSKSSVLKSANSTLENAGAGLVNKVTRMTKEQAEVAGYTWVTTYEELNSALNKSSDKPSKVMLGCDIDFSGRSSINNSSSNSVQEINGNGFAIKNGSTNVFSSYVNEGQKVCNLVIDNFNYTPTYNIGGLLADYIYGTVDNVVIKNSNINFTGTNSTTYSFGFFATQLNGGTITNSATYNCNMVLNTASSSSWTDYDIHAGGLVGYMQRECVITNSNVYKTNISVTDTNHVLRIGGIAGTMDSGTLIKDCEIANTTISASGTRSAYSGGIVGSLDSMWGSYTISGCKTSASVTASCSTTLGAAATGAVLGGYIRNNFSSTSNVTLNFSNTTYDATFAGTSKAYGYIDLSGREYYDTIYTAGTEDITGVTAGNLKDYLGADILIYNSSGTLLATLDFSTTNSLYDFFDALEPYGFSGSVVDGVLTLTSADGNYIEGSIPKALGLSATSATQTSTLYSSLTFDSKLSDFGINDDVIVNAVVDGIEFPLTFNKANSVNDILNALKENGFIIKTQDGKVTINGKKDFYIKDMSAELADLLQLTVGENYSYIIKRPSVSATSTVAITLTSSKNIYLNKDTLLNNVGADPNKALIGAVNEITKEQAIASNYIWVTTAEELQAAVNANKTFVLGDDIDLSNYDWQETSFGGTLYGNGHTISGLTGEHSGLFTTFYGSVQDLVLSDFNLKTKYYTISDSFTNHYNSGVLAAEINYRAKINNITFNNITVDNSRGLDFGCVAGYVDRSSGSSTSLYNISANNINIKTTSTSIHDSDSYTTTPSGGTTIPEGSATGIIVGYAKISVNKSPSYGGTSYGTLSLYTVRVSGSSITYSDYDNSANSGVRLEAATGYIGGLVGCVESELNSDSSSTTVRGDVTTNGGVYIVDSTINVNGTAYAGGYIGYTQDTNVSLTVQVGVKINGGSSAKAGNIIGFANSNGDYYYSATRDSRINNGLSDVGTECGTTITCTAKDMAGVGTHFGIYNSGGSLLYTMNIDSTTTINDLLKKMSEYGIDASFSNGVLSITSTNGNYVKGVSADALGISSQTVQSVTLKTSLTSDSLLSKFGLQNDATINIVADGVERTIDISTTDSLNDMIAKLQYYGFNISTVNDKLIINGGKDLYIKDMTQELADILAFTVGENYSYKISTDGSGGDGDGGFVIVTIISNSTSDLLTTDSEGSLSQSTTLNELGLVDDRRIILNSDGQNYTVTIKATDTIGDMFTMLAGYDIAGAIDNNNKITLTGGKQSYITFIDNDLANILKMDYGKDKTYQDKINNTESNTLLGTATIAMTTSTTLEKLGLKDSANIIVENNGTLYTVTVSGSQTVDDILTTLAGLGVSGSVSDGKITLQGTADGIIKSMDSTLEDIFKIETGEDKSWSGSTIEEIKNTDSKDLTYTTDGAIVDINTKLADINSFDNGNGNLVIHQTNGQFVTISIDATKTLGEFFTDISKYGLVGNIHDGKVSIEGIGNVYMQAADGGSNILTALKLSNVIQNVQTVTVNRNSDVLSHTVTVAASGTTQLGNLADSLGNTMGTGDGTLILSTTSDAGSQTVTLTFDRTKSIYDVIDALAGYGIDASLDALGKFSINSSTLTDFSISGNLGTLLMGTYTKVYGKGETFNISTNLVEQTTLPMSKTDLLSSFGITNGNILVTQQGVNYTVNIDTTSVKTVADFMKLLASYGFESEIDSAGRLYVSGVGKSYLSSISDGSNILDKFGLTNWSLGEVKQESKHLGDKKVDNITCSFDTKLNELTDSAGNNLGITSGNIYVYQDGTRYLVNIDNNDTLQTLSAKLAQYGITMGLSTEGKLYFDGTNDSYMTTNGITNGASNILSKLNIADNWSTRYDSTSKSLSSTTKTNNVVSGSTKLSDLQDSDGKNLGITTGAFYVYNSGSRSTESITADMTVNDLMATLAKHGLVADIAEDGSISIGAYNNTYLATSALTSDNSNIVSKLFSEWNFVNIYTSKGLDIPVDEVTSINRNTKLSAINEGKYQEGYITVVKDGVQTNIKLTSDDTVGTLMDELSLYGFESVINEKGQLLIKNTGNSLLQKYTGSDQASNALELLGIDLNNWIQTSSYKSDTLKVTQTSTIDSDVTRDTLLSELGVTTGEYNIFKNGVKFTAYISTGETMGSFLDTLKSFGIETSLVSDGDSSILTIIGSGDTYIAKSNSTTGASNVVEKLFADNDKYSSFHYKGLEQTSETVTHFTAATKDTLLSEFNKLDGSNTLKAEGDLSVTVNGETATIKIEADETFGSLIEKFKALGLEASISSSGQLMIQSGYNTFTINSDGTNSNLLSNIGLVYHKDLGGYVASTDTLKATTTTIEEKTFSVANYAGYDTKMSLMNISSGTLSVYLNGQKATIKIDKNQTFGDLRSLVSTEFADVDLTFEDGYIKFYSKKDGDKVEVGATTDTSNFAAITGITSDGNGAVKSARELFCVNNSSVITNSGLFRKGDVTKGTFTVGNATFTIDEKTTISDIISQINSNDEANATAYWDSIEGNFVIKSRTTGSALINIEAGTSNFTDIMGYTNSEWAADGSLNVTRMNTASQEVGNNAKFSINGTYYTSTSNNITSDVSRIKGLTINLKGLTDGSAITLTVERDKETLANAVSDIVDSYNELMDNVDKEITKDGKLKDQSTLKLIRNQLRSLMTSSDAGTTIFRNLDAIGIKVEAASGNNISTSGLTTLTFDKDKFFEAFKADQGAVKDLLVGSKNNTGIFTKVEDLVESSLKSVSGYFESTDKSYQKQINKLDNKIEKQKTALERYRAQLESKFSSMDILIANMQQQYSSFLRT